MLCYLMVIHGDVEPELRGPFLDADARDEAATAHRKEDPDMKDGLYPMNVRLFNGVQPESVDVDVESYSGGFFMDDGAT